MSSTALTELSRRAAAIAADLKKNEPSTMLALEAGIIDTSYDTTACGRVASYRGTAVVTMDDGTKWRCVGHTPQGNAYSVTRDGYIEYLPL